MDQQRIRILWPVILEVERAAATSLVAQRKHRVVSRVYPTRGSRHLRTLRTDRAWTNGDIARLGNIWNRVMAGTGAPGVLNATEE